ncbi:hypothetical protein Vadar_021329 [Vaccinium darrowii]|uniref:Uncharacterized protein n=1 Tax=Vaccinium darrowii TaxID=229202 RepID=A0ACB7YNN5_9ERIC|nr:hypothetical protein Vadar_021329 [Vaccinium darrowii]
MEEHFLKQSDGSQVPLEILASNLFYPYFKANTILFDARYMLRSGPIASYRDLDLSSKNLRVKRRLSLQPPASAAGLGPKLGDFCSRDLSKEVLCDKPPLDFASGSLWDRIGDENFLRDLENREILLAEPQHLSLIDV